MSETVVSNTGPLIALAAIGRLNILETLFQRVLISATVRAELEAGTRVRFRFYEIESLCRILSVAPDPPADPLLVGVLDRGEASSILLARLEKPRYVLLDERKGRKIAAHIFSLPVIGTAGLLVLAKRNGLLPNVREPIEEMIARGYYIHPRIRDLALRLADEIS